MVGMSAAARGVLAGVGLVLLGLFAALGVVAGPGPHGPDAALIATAHGWRTPALTDAVRVLNAVLSPALGWAVAALIAVAAILAAARRAWPAAIAAGCAFAGYVAVWRAVTAVKAIAARPRPAGVPLEHDSGYSYPSGHVAAVTAATAAVLVAAWWWRRLVPAAAAAAVLLPLVAGFDRVYLGVHFPTDVAGAVCGIWGGMLLGLAAWGGVLSWSGPRPPSRLRGGGSARRSMSTAAPGG